MLDEQKTFLESKEIMKIENIVVIYPNGVIANRDVSLNVNRGEILGILGENGAGKTTLMKVISGSLRPTKGAIYVNAKKVHFHSSRDALRLGIAMAPQHPQLFGGLTAIEDLGLSFKLAGIDISRDYLKFQVESVKEKYGLSIDPEAKIWRLSMGERQKIDLIRVILLGKKIIILDEPTTHLTPMESERLISIMKKLSNEGRAIIFITHKLREAIKASDRIAVMRKGKIVGLVNKNDVNEEKLLKLMFGEKIELKVEYESSKSVSKEKSLEIIDLWTRGVHGTWSVKNARLHVLRGEIVGIAGIAGNGQKELFETLIGIRKPSRGKIIIKGIDVTRKSPLDRRLLGLAIIPEERLGWALVPQKNVLYNIAFTLAFTNGSFLVNWNKYKVMTKKAIEMFDIRLGSINDPVHSLSGGNMQKLIVARELLRNVDIILAMNPTAGLDFKATLAVRKSLVISKHKGASVLLISEDLDELVELSDRIYVMSRGKVVGPFGRPFNLKKIAKAMTE